NRALDPYSAHAVLRGVVSFDVITRLPSVSTVSGAPRRSALRPRAEYAVVTEVQKVLGSLPVVAEFSRRIGIAEIIDNICPIRELAQLTNGQVIEALIANRLSSPTAMVRVADWAQDCAVEEVYGFPGAWLNDDRIARALDAIAPHVQTITGSVGAAAIEAFGIDVTRIHWDMTSISLYGDYDGADPAFPTPDYGHPKDRRTDLKQIQAGVAVTADGGIPVWHKAYDGGANEVAQVVEAMNESRKMAKPPRQLLVGDSKLISHANVTAMTAPGVTFIAPLAAAAPARISTNSSAPPAPATTPTTPPSPPESTSSPANTASAPTSSPPSPSTTANRP
ncbi:MAG: hypothetical protein QOE61_2960, partial [Micromonosporaceae bacterium]|nr:hypothetical protein [Micromonosporaceae bacterium]